MKPETLVNLIIRPTLLSLPSYYYSPEAVLLMAAISLQETMTGVRKQKGGPAVGLWQFEPLTGLADFVSEGRPDVKAFVRDLGFSVSIRSLSPVLQVGGDHVACAIARERLYRMIRQPLPERNDIEEAWRQYKKAWGPGKPDHERWNTLAYPLALDATYHIESHISDET